MNELEFHTLTCFSINFFLIWNQNGVGGYFLYISLSLLDLLKVPNIKKLGCIIQAFFTSNFFPLKNSSKVWNLSSQHTGAKFKFSLIYCFVNYILVILLIYHANVIHLTSNDTSNSKQRTLIMVLLHLDSVMQVSCGLRDGKDVDQRGHAKNGRKVLETIKFVVR